jgi:hypothetical protein
MLYVESTLTRDLLQPLDAHQTVFVPAAVPSVWYCADGHFLAESFAVDVPQKMVINMLMNKTQGSTQ